VTGSDDRLVKIWSVASGYLLCTCRGHTGDITDLSVNADDTLLASGSNDNRVCVWHLSTQRTGDKALGALAGVCKGHHQELAEINFNPVVPNLLLTASFDGTARLWNVEALHKGAIICRPTPGGPRDAAGGDGRAAPADTPERARGGGGGGGEAGWSATVGVSPGGGAAALSAAEMQARVDLKIKSCGWSADGSLLAVGRSDCMISVFSIDQVRMGSSSTQGGASGARDWQYKLSEHCELAGHRNEVNHLVFSRTSAALLSSSRDGSIRVWQPERGAAAACRAGRRNWTAHVVLAVEPPPPPPPPPGAAARRRNPPKAPAANLASFSLDDSCIVSIYDDFKLRIW
jgi:PH-interacting protein